MAMGLITTQPVRLWAEPTSIKKFPSKDQQPLVKAPKWWTKQWPKNHLKMSSDYSHRSKFTHQLIFSSSLSYNSGMLLHSLHFSSKHDVSFLLFLNSITPHPHSLWSGQYVAPSKRSLKSPHSHRAALILFLGLRSSLNKMWTLVKKLWTEFRTANFKLHMAKHTVVFKNHQIIWYHISIESYHSRSKVRDKREVSRWRNSPVGHWAATAFGDVYCNLKIWATSLISLHCWALQPCSAQQSLHME